MDGTVGQAPFELVAAEIRKAMREGELKPGDKLPPHRKLASQYGITTATVQRALRVLQEEGRLKSRPTIGVFVTEAAAEPEPLSLRQLAAEVAALRERVETLERSSGLPVAQ
ncbi:GntR family transcriptional regulator [Amycolatopsis suaedae]|uniref:GntR family transcriptional regulator n=1 Tax=Amycolatopsis suaedae TaxID=2510978 RepID=A0A4Q7J1V6_9PSEU|nr:winged helix-turn-helix domain-containing protein [Amycolatopsis suaedae]RZQ60849.1 GntR family transcriptional regulator [Amycolatopsis suaedae]